MNLKRGGGGNDQNAQYIPLKQHEVKIHIWSVVYQNRVKRVSGVHF